MPFQHVYDNTKQRQEDPEVEPIFTLEGGGRRFVCSSCGRKNVNHYLRTLTTQARQEVLRTDPRYCALGKGEKTCGKCLERRRNRPKSSRKTKAQLEDIIKKQEELIKELLGEVNWQMKWSDLPEWKIKDYKIIKPDPEEPEPKQEKPKKKKRLLIVEEPKCERCDGDGCGLCQDE